ncbi:MAG TPA: V-type ATP synthase subunit F [Sedimentisphaerales bacterium]|nr:V-type ATP synthase subunit F [Sedimentisphaerales bacterium]
MKGKVAVLGDADFVMPFSALGLDTFPVGQADADITESAAKIIEGKYTLVVVAENIAPAVQEAFSPTLKAPTPCIVVVPFTTESEGFATEALAQVLKMATGVNLIQENQKKA